MNLKFILYTILKEKKKNPEFERQKSKAFMKNKNRNKKL